MKNANINMFALSARLLFAFIHLFISVFIVAIALGTILPLWYPVGYLDVSEAWIIFSLLLIVNLCIGPLMTLIVFNKKKSVKTLKNDLFWVALLQTTALIYGISVAAEARPVALVFSVDRFSLIFANNVRQNEIPHAQLEFQQLSWSGPLIVATRPAANNEILDAVTLAAQGFDLAQRPTYWKPFVEQQQQAYLRGRPLPELLNRFSLSALDFCKSYLSSPCIINDIHFLPLEARNKNWIVLVNSLGNVLGFAPFDGFE